MGKKEFSVRPFEKLKKTIAHRPAPPSPPQKQQQKKKEQYTDEELFGREMSGVVEIGSFRSLSCAKRPGKPRSAAGARHADEQVISTLKKLADGSGEVHLPDTQEYVEWVNPDHHDTIIPKLHAGQYSVQASLDLHGFTVTEAEEEVDIFLEDAFQKGLSCVKIIHGRGLRSVKGARLKQAVIKRLSGRYRKDLIAYVTARQCDGGLGALYVLLRKK